MFRAHVLIVRRAKLHYTVSGIIIPVGGHPVHGTATYRCDDTRDCIIQFCPPDNEHMCSKHVEAWNKIIIKFSASSWLILINKYIEMHGQQNIKICKNAVYLCINELFHILLSLWHSFGSVEYMYIHKYLFVYGLSVNQCICESL